jgi:heme/copper-type cytochrome/quinol oxidase subunit 2
MSGRWYARAGMLLAALALVVALNTAAAACPNCKEALAASDPHQENVVRGYFYSILLMMGMPFAMVAGFSLYMWREVRRARGQASQSVGAVPKSATTAAARPSSGA